MTNSIKLFITLCREVTQNQVSKKTCNEKPIGTAILRKDSFTGKKYWTTWKEDSQSEVTFSAGQPLMFPPEGLRIGVRVHLLPPEDEKYE